MAERLRFDHASLTGEAFGFDAEGAPAPDGWFAIAIPDHLAPWVDKLRHHPVHRGKVRLVRRLEAFRVACPSRDDAIAFVRSALAEGLACATRVERVILVLSEEAPPVRRGAAGAGARVALQACVMDRATHVRGPHRKVTFAAPPVGEEPEADRLNALRAREADPSAMRAIPFDPAIARSLRGMVEAVRRVSADLDATLPPREEPRRG